MELNDYRMSGKTVAQQRREIVSALTPLYGEGESNAICRLIFEQLKGWSAVDIVIKANEELSEFITQQISNVMQRLLNYEPVQYVLGVAHFYGMKFQVTRDTLIPRPETAELIDLIVGANEKKDLRVLDIGTGSGCIAIALSRNLAFAQVTAVDVSASALAIARSNALKLHASVSFVEADILQPVGSFPNELHQQFDVIVSNPPYIAEHERREMERNVLDYEPATALFVPDENPLLFYDAITRYAVDALAPDGKLYFEINPHYVGGMIRLCNSMGFAKVEAFRDSFGKERFIAASRR